MLYCYLTKGCQVNIFTSMTLTSSICRVSSEIIAFSILMNWFMLWRWKCIRPESRSNKITKLNKKKTAQFPNEIYQGVWLLDIPKGDIEKKQLESPRISSWRGSRRLSCGLERDAGTPYQREGPVLRIRFHTTTCAEQIPKCFPRVRL